MPPGVSAHRPDSGARPRGTDVLLRALVEAEIDGVAVANQLTALKEAMDGLPGVRVGRLGGGGAASFARGCFCVNPFCLERAPVEGGPGLTEAPARASDGEDGDVRPHKPQPAGAPQGAQRQRGTGGGGSSSRGVQMPRVCHFPFAPIPRGSPWRGPNAKTP